jgi:alpha-1,3-glucosyltransferase
MFIHWWPRRVSRTTLLTDCSQFNASYAPFRISHLFNIGMVTIATFALVFSPFLFSPVLLLQSLHRIFPFARGLFEDKVANFWCALNIVIKLRDIASVSTLAKLALLTTLLAILPGVVGLIWISNEVGRRRRANEVKWPETVLPEGTGITPTLILLPHALFVSSMAFFLFSFQVHEKSILLPLMPLTLLMGGREAGFARMDWEWAVLMNNVAVFR